MPRMLQAFNTLLAPALMQRLTLLLNHVIDSEPAARQLLRPRDGALVQFHLENWPRLLPPPPVLCWRVTPAGLLEWSETPPAVAQLHVRVDASNPAALMLQALGGTQPPLQLDGDAALAADINWLLQNLRWDVAADLERVLGAAAAQQLSALGAALARGLRQALVGGAARWRTGS
jgi:ubiquinone biosynthesis protein UbiJ